MRLLLLAAAGLSGLALGACQPAAPAARTCKLEGNWLTTGSGGQRQWTIKPDGSISSRESNTAAGKATLVDHRLTIEFDDPVGPSAGVYELNLSPDCTKAEGTVRMTKGPPQWPLTSGPVTGELQGG